MDSIGLTLRSKSRRPRPQISHPKPISGPLPANSKAAGPGHGTASSKGSKDKASLNATTSDLVKRRYSTRFNQAPDIEPEVPPVPGLSQGGAAAYNGKLGSPPIDKILPSSDPSQPISVDLNALRDPSLPVDRCEFHPTLTRS